MRNNCLLKFLKFLSKLLQQMFQLKKVMKSDQVEIPEEIRMPDRVEIPYGVVELLLNYIPNYSDHLNFKAVCKLWRFVEYDHPGPPSELPWLVFLSSEGERKFYEICSKKFYDNPIPRVESGANFFGSYCDGWLLCRSDSPRSLFLNNSYSGDRLSLPSKTILCLNPNPIEECASPVCEWVDMTHVSIVKTVFSCSPSSNGYLVASLNRLGCSLTISRPHSNNSLATTVHLGGEGFIDIIFYRNKIIGVDRSKSVYFLGIEENAKGLAQVTSFHKGEMKNFDFPVPTFSNGSANCHGANLVQISDKVFMVVRYYGGSGCANSYTLGFKIYELVWKRPLEWVEVKSLPDDHAIFLDSYVSRVFHASRFPEVKGDHIYFTSCCELFDTGVFSIRDQSISNILPAEHFSSQSKPIWLFPPNGREGHKKKKVD